MKKALRGLSRLGALAACALCLCALGKVPIEVVFEDDAIFFVLDAPREIAFLRVGELINPSLSGRKRKAPDNLKTVWLLGQDLSSKVNTRRYPTLDRIRYGRKFAEFPRVEGPIPLKQGVVYLVDIDMGGKFANATFMISKDNTVIIR